MKTEKKVEEIRLAGKLLARFVRFNNQFTGYNFSID
jgi:hypothetical protein